MKENDIMLHNVTNDIIVIECRNNSIFDSYTVTDKTELIWVLGAEYIEKYYTKIGEL